MIDNPQVLSALIIATGTVTAAIVAATVGALVGKKFLNQKKLQSDLERAIRDIHFLLEVEKRHCNIHTDNDGSSKLRTVRKYVKNEVGESWSGRFTPGREGLRVKV